MLVGAVHVAVFLKLWRRRFLSKNVFLFLRCYQNGGSVGLSLDTRLTFFFWRGGGEPTHFELNSGGRKWREANQEKRNVLRNITNVSSLSGALSNYWGFFSLYQNVFWFFSCVSQFIARKLTSWKWLGGNHFWCLLSPLRSLWWSEDSSERIIALERSYQLRTFYKLPVWRFWEKKLVSCDWHTQFNNKQINVWNGDFFIQTVILRQVNREVNGEGLLERRKINLKRK